MKKIILLLLISLNAVSQVFEVDSTFKFEVVKKRIAVQNPAVGQLPNGLLYLNYVGNVFDGNLTDTKSYLLDPNGKVVSKSTLDFDPRSDYDIITTDNKFLVRDYSQYPSYKLQKYLPTGVVDSTFKFPSSNLFLYKTFLMPNNNFMTISNENGSGLWQYLIYNENGKFLKALNLALLGFPEKIFRLNSLVFNEKNDCFLLINDDERNTIIIKTNQNFEIDKTFSKIQYTLNEYDGSNFKIQNFNNGLLLYGSSSSVNKNFIEKYDQNGKKIQVIAFDFVTEYFTSQTPRIYVQNDKSIDLIFYDNSHLKILPDGRLDTLYYKNEKQKNIIFLHSFPDGTYLIMRNKSGTIEKMYADGSIDTNFKINLQNEIKLFPLEIKKLANNNYLVVFDQITSTSSSPYVIRWSRNFNSVRTYNSKHQFIQEVFDAKTRWETSSSEKSFFVRGDKKIIKIDSSLKMTTSVDSMGLDSITVGNSFIYSILDYKNGLVYKIERDRNSKQRSITRYRISTGRYDMFNIFDDDINNINTLSDGRIAVFGFLAESQNKSYFIDIYNTNGKKDESMKRIIVSNQRGIDGILSIEYNRGFIVTFTNVGGVGNVWQTFYRFNEDGSPDEKYVSNEISGGQFVKYQPDGTIYTNSGTSKQSGYNNLNKILPNGKMDSSFAVNGVDIIFDYVFKDEYTLYAVCDNTIKRFIRNPVLNAGFFNLQPLPSSVPWDYGGILKVNYRTNLKNLKVIVTGDAILKDSVITLTSKRAGIIKLQIFDELNNLLAVRNIVVKKVTPFFIYDLPRLTNSLLPFTFTAQSSSELPVKIKAFDFPFGDKLVIYPETKKFFEVNLVSEGNEQYESIESNISVLIMEEPLANEPEESLIYYPNPVKETLFVDINKLKIDDFKLISMDGREIPISVSGFVGRYEISLRNVPSGLYILQANTQTKRFTYRIVVD